MTNRKPSSKPSSPKGGRSENRLRLTKAASEDLAAIDAYGVERFGEDAADEYIRGFHEAFALLRAHPLAGAERAELGRAIRCFVHMRHRLFYRVTGNEVLVIRIVHHAQDARAAFRKAGAE
ncbi:hypothetical protein GCM10007897_24640 [Sphingobium jiangsuense]|uniref:type II toxin-antitoxin system RelE/ParE family toxin n=1 Tax=Sphingobium jiangsuense TaxID=870476 RepID=UPI00165DFC44|nr:hypothetical protein GCM10007897_24640 [Sphingobium jiangsuense]